MKSMRHLVLALILSATVLGFSASVNAASFPEAWDHRSYDSSMTRDFTISDVIDLIQTVFYFPGDVIVMIVHTITGAFSVAITKTNFLELNYYPPFGGGWSLILSLMSWVIIWTLISGIFGAAPTARQTIPKSTKKFQYVVSNPLKITDGQIDAILKQIDIMVDRNGSQMGDGISQRKIVKKIQKSKRLFVAEKEVIEEIMREIDNISEKEE